MTSDVTSIRRLGDAPPNGLLDDGERLSADELAALQLAACRPHCATPMRTCPTIGQVRRGRGRPADCVTLDDLARFPFTTKEDLRATYPFGMFAVPMSQVRRVHASSGTTGRPTVVGYTENDIDMWAYVVARSIRAAGGRAGHKVHIAYGYGLFTGVWCSLRCRAGRCTVIPASGGMTARRSRSFRISGRRSLWSRRRTC